MNPFQQQSGFPFPRLLSLCRKLSVLKQFVFVFYYLKQHQCLLVQTYDMVAKTSLLWAFCVFEAAILGVNVFLSRLNYLCFWHSWLQCFLGDHMALLNVPTRNYLIPFVEFKKGLLGHSLDLVFPPKPISDCLPCF